jgi:hypothetical protein
MGMDEVTFKSVIMQNSDKSLEELLMMISDMSGQSYEELIAGFAAAMNMSPDQLTAKMYGYDDHTIS